MVVDPAEGLDSEELSAAAWVTFSGVAVLLFIVRIVMIGGGGFWSSQIMPRLPQRRMDGFAFPPTTKSGDPLVFMVYAVLVLWFSRMMAF